MKLFVSALFCLKFLCAAAASTAAHPGDELYVFPGQGTCVMYFTEIDGVSTAVISDAGAFNGVHPKFTVESEELALLRPKPVISEETKELYAKLAAQQRCGSPERRPLGTVEVNTPPRTAKKPLPEDGEDTDQSQNTPPDPRRGRECSPETITASSAQKHKKTINFQGKIKEAFDRFNVVRIVCFFSHCDKDHWNLHAFLPALPTIYVLGLGWSKANLNNLKKPHSYVFKINEEVVSTGFGDYIFSRKYRHLAFGAMGISDSYIKALNSIHLWGINLCPTDGRNENSMLLSITSQQLNKTFFMTGDATPETFDALEEKKINPAELIKSAYPDALNHLVFAIVPHHGSSATFPHKFLTMVNPDAFIFTAGRGNAYGHPRMDIVTHLLKSKNRRVWSRFNMVNPVSFLGFQPTGGKGSDVRYQPMNVTLTMDNPLILGTNISQRLRFSREGVEQEFNPFLYIDDQQYTWDYCNHVYDYSVEKKLITPTKDGLPAIHKTYNNEDRIISYDSDGTPIAYFIQINPELWYGYLIEQPT